MQCPHRSIELTHACGASEAARAVSQLSDSGVSSFQEIMGIRIATFQFVALGTGSDASEILDAMPGLPGLGVSGLTISTTSSDIDSGSASSLNVDVSDLTLVYNSVDDSAQNRTNVMKVVRY